MNKGKSIAIACLAVLCAFLLFKNRAAKTEIKDLKSEVDELLDENTKLEAGKEELSKQIKDLSDDYDTGFEVGHEEGYELGYYEGYQKRDWELDDLTVSSLSFMIDTPNSSCFSQVGYYEKSLYVTFRNNNQSYVYYNVPESEYQNLISADSAGSYYNEHIKDSYSYGKIIDGTESVEKIVYEYVYDNEETYWDGYDSGEEAGYENGYRDGYSECEKGYGNRY